MIGLARADISLEVTNATFLRLSFAASRYFLDGLGEQRPTSRFNMHDMTPDHALAHLSRDLAIALEFSAQGLCRLRIGGQHIVDLEVDDSRESIFIYCRMGTLPGGDAGAGLLVRLMRAHCLGRETARVQFGLDQDDVMAFSRVELRGAADDALRVALEALIELTDQWSRELI